MRVLQLLKWGAVAAVGLAIAFCVAIYLLASRSLPDYAAEHTAKDLIGDVEIVRDSRATPHIFGASEGDIFFALGFVHAQDRLWQMEFTRRLAQGRLSEIGAGWIRSLSSTGGGDPTAELLRLDITARALDISGAAEKSFDALSDDSKEALERYAAGVNAWLEIVDEDSMGAGAPELLVLGGVVDPWKPSDAIAVVKVYAALTSTPFLAELSRARFTFALGPAHAKDLFPGGSVTPFAGGSSAWAVTAKRSGTGAPLLAADLHSPLIAPTTWYVARLDFGDGSVIGATLPGAPVIFAGRNQRIAWSLADFAADTADFYIEQEKPDDPDQYRTPDGWAPFEKRTERVALGDGDAIEVEVLRTRHGPVLPLSWPEITRITPQGHVAALSWTALASDDTTIEGMLRLMRAKSVDAAIKLRPSFVAPAQMIVVADRSGIASFGVGRIPLRRADSLAEGRVPGSGWSAQNDWTGFIDPGSLPLSRNPAEGFVAVADNAPISPAERGKYGYDWPAPYRYARLKDLLANRSYHSLSGFQTMQEDVSSEMARQILPIVARDLWARLGTEQGQMREALELLRTWVLNSEETPMDQLRSEPLIFSAWMRTLTRRLVEDELNGLLDGFRGARPRFIERVFKDVDGAAARWCDDQRTPAAESCSEIARLALGEALVELTAAYGGQIRNWRWGRAHNATHAHLVFGDSALMSILFTIEHELGGDEYTLRRTRQIGYGPTPYATVRAGTFRAVYDFAEIERSVYAIATGQSGHVLSRHFDDFSPLWRGAGYAPLTLSRREIEAGAVGVTRLKPAE